MYDYIKEGGGGKKFRMKHNDINCRTDKSDNKRIPSLKYQIYIVKIANLYVHECEKTHPYTIFECTLKNLKFSTVSYRTSAENPPQKLCFCRFLTIPLPCG